jgi:hypothetical protein
MIASLTENFKIWFNDFHSHATNIRIVEVPFSVEGSDDPVTSQLELAELQCDSILRDSFNQEYFITFYAPLPVSLFSELRKLERNLVSVSAKKWTCE